jgi:small ligand-binding sensory domain FIST
MTFTAGIPEGSEVRLMISDVEEGLQTAELATRMLLKKLGGRKPKAVIVVNSVARKKMFGPRADEEIQTIQKILGRDVPMAGFYSYAQIGGQLGDKMPFHNGSLLIWAMTD